MAFLFDCILSKDRLRSISPRWNRTYLTTPHVEDLGNLVSDYLSLERFALRIMRYRLSSPIKFRNFCTSRFTLVYAPVSFSAGKEKHCMQSLLCEWEFSDSPLHTRWRNIGRCNVKQQTGDDQVQCTNYFRKMRKGEPNTLTMAFSQHRPQEGGTGMFICLLCKNKDILNP